ncbi:uncharacterized protein LOC116923043 [Daphnia magna]|uniref:uncharacterized protein LOC116923043 n=1 Tax=Daphnia magna TaxID=35525 RepID=UPI001E1BCF5F|nr:uncharacterized protein LOC116923043 [Daphnia magna]
MPRRAGYDTTGLTFLIDVETLRLSCVKMRYCALPADIATECNEPTSHFPMFTCLNYGCEGTLVLPKCYFFLGTKTTEYISPWRQMEVYKTRSWKILIEKHSC